MQLNDGCGVFLTWSQIIILITFLCLSIWSVKIFLIKRKKSLNSKALLKISCIIFILFLFLQIIAYLFFTMILNNINRSFEDFGATYRISLKNALNCDIDRIYLNKIFGCTEDAHCQYLYDCGRQEEPICIKGECVMRVNTRLGVC